jgi:hypothetical protein
LRPLACPLVLLLLARSQLLELLECLVELLLRLLLLTALHLLVLVAKLVRLQLEQVGKIFCVGLLLPTAATSTTAHADLDVAVHRLGALQHLQRALFRR